MAKGDMHGRCGGCMAGGACVVGGMHGVGHAFVGRHVWWGAFMAGVGGMHGRGHVWWGHAWCGACICGEACVVGGTHGRGHVGNEGMHGGGHEWQVRWQLQRTVRILLECSLVLIKVLQNLLLIYSQVNQVDALDIYDNPQKVSFIITNGIF